MKKLIDYLKESITDFPGASVYYREDWECEYFNIEGKCFCMLGENKDLGTVFTVKGDPEKNLELREIYPFIVPGYYANKKHWNTVILEESNLTNKELVKLLRESYNLVFAKLPKKVRDSITN